MPPLGDTPKGRAGTPPYVHSRYISRAFVVALQEAGVQIEAILARAGLGEAALEGPLPAPGARAFIRLAFDAVGDPAFGLELGARVRPELFNVVSFAAMSSATCSEALARLARYKRMFSPDRLEIDAGPAFTTIHVHMADADESYGRQWTEYELSLLVSSSRVVTGHPIRAERVAVPFPRPAYHARYEAIFGCPATFDAAGAVLVFRRADMELPLRSQNLDFARFFAQRAEEMLAASDGEPALAARVRAELRRRLRGDPPDMRRVARQLTMSERSLQRKLQQEGTSFLQLVDEVRLDLARRHMRDGRFSAEDVAFLLGFAHPNSFYRAFKRWTGMTPDEYRHSATAET